MFVKHRSSTLTTFFAAGLAGATAGVGWVSLAYEYNLSVTDSLGKGRALAEALLLYFRFFTILTNLGIAVLMSVAFVRLIKRRPLPPAPIFNAGLIYVLVTCVTYEMMLRALWAPSGMHFFTDCALHDLVPALTLVFWLCFAPRDGARWRNALLFLAYPLAYFVMTLVIGALGEGYPYDFLDVDRLGLPKVLSIAAMFLLVFYILGLITTGLSMWWGRSSNVPMTVP